MQCPPSCAELSVAGARGRAKAGKAALAEEPATEAATAALGQLDAAGPSRATDEATVLQQETEVPTDAEADAPMDAEADNTIGQEPAAQPAEAQPAEKPQQASLGPTRTTRARSGAAHKDAASPRSPRSELGSAAGASAGSGADQPAAEEEPGSPGVPCSPAYCARPCLAQLSFRLLFQLMSSCCASSHGLALS